MYALCTQVAGQCAWFPPAAELCIAGVCAPQAVQYLPLSIIELLLSRYGGKKKNKRRTLVGGGSVSPSSSFVQIYLIHISERHIAGMEQVTGLKWRVLL